MTSVEKRIMYRSATHGLILLCLVCTEPVFSAYAGTSRLQRLEHAGGRKRTVPRTCGDVPDKSSGIYEIQPERGFIEPFLVLCDQEYADGGWTVIQNRFNGSVNFLRPWNEYKHGFGDLDGEFWLGLDKIHQLTYGTPHELDVVLEDWEGGRVVASYRLFEIASETELYKMKKLGAYSGTAGDSLRVQENQNFSTLDRKYDSSPNENCAQKYSGAWWHNGCHDSNLNGLYLKGWSETFADGMCWKEFRGYYYALKSSRMMIRSLV